MGEKDCALCFRSFKFHKIKPTENADIEKLKTVCGTYIKPDISENNSNVTWDDRLWMRDNPLCPSCNDNAKHLLSLDDRLQQIQNELTAFAKIFSNEVFKYRMEKVEMKDSDSAPAINREIKEEIYSHSDDSNSYGNGWSDAAYTDNGSQSAPTIDPEIKEEKSYYSDDSNFYEIPVLCSLEDISSRKARPKRKAALKTKESRCEISSSDEDTESEDDFVPIPQKSKPGRKKSTKKIAKSRRESPKTKQTAQGGRKWKCNICNETFFRIMITEKRHMRAFHPEEEKIEGSISCEICQETFEGPVLPYKIHCLEHKEEIAFECQLCHRTYPSIQSYTDHYKFTACGKLVMIENSGGVEKTFKCNTCDEEFCANYLLLLHRLSHINFSESDITCEVCGKPFSVESRGSLSLEKHFLSHTKELPYPCDICGKPHGYIYYLDQHRHTHKGNVNKCDVCGGTFSNPTSLNHHMKNVRCSKQKRNLQKKRDVKRWQMAGGIKFVCNICGNECRTEKDLENHKKIEHTEAEKEIDTSNNSKEFQCDICGLDFIRKSNYTKHLKWHTEENPYQCANADCQQKFRVFYDLKKHYNENPNCKSVKDAKHDNYKHKCKICGKRERTQAGLRLHEMRHTGEKPHLCEICGMSFNRRDRLRIHTQKHDESYVKNPLSCKTCQFKCKSMKYLLRHYKENPTCHSKLQETKKHGCDICGHRFYTKYKLMVHCEEKHQGEGLETKITKSLKCKTCQKEFYFKQQLFRHEKTHEKY